VRTKSPVRRVEADKVLLADGSEIPYGILVWSTGFGPTNFVRELPFQKDPRGRIVTDEFLRVQGHSDIYALGDCAAAAGQNPPMTAQIAQHAGKYLAKSLNRLAASQPPTPFRDFSFGMLAYIGGYRALANTPGIRWRGFMTWLLWRSVYVTKLVSVRNKARVAFDWIKTWLFGRDVTTF